MRQTRHTGLTPPAALTIPQKLARFKEPSQSVFLT
jgi:hypothetical protein